VSRVVERVKPCTTGKERDIDWKESDSPLSLSFYSVFSKLVKIVAEYDGAERQVDLSPAYPLPGGVPRQHQPTPPRFASNNAYLLAQFLVLLW